MSQYIYAHRGASAYAPENTLEAFKMAADMGAHGVELDVHICRSGELVVTHDEVIQRVSDGEGWVKDMSLSELKVLHFNRTHPEFKDARIDDDAVRPFAGSAIVEHLICCFLQNCFRQNCRAC